MFFLRGRAIYHARCHGFLFFAPDTQSPQDGRSKVRAPDTMPDTIDPCHAMTHSTNTEYWPQGNPRCSWGACRCCCCSLKSQRVFARGAGTALPVIAADVAWPLSGLLKLYTCFKGPSYTPCQAPCHITCHIPCHAMLNINGKWWLDGNHVYLYI